MYYDKNKSERMYEKSFVVGFNGDDTERHYFHAVIDVHIPFIIRCVIYKIDAVRDSLTGTVVSEFAYEAYGITEDLNYPLIADTCIKLFILGSSTLRRIE